MRIFPLWLPFGGGFEQWQRHMGLHLINMVITKCTYGSKNVEVDVFHMSMAVMARKIKLIDFEIFSY
jgi:hypothetical protein